MKALKVMCRVMALRPRFIWKAVLLLLFSSSLAAVSVFGIAPIIDLLMRSETRPQSPVTLYVTEWMQAAGLPVSVLSATALFLALMVAKNAALAFARWVITRLRFRLVEETVTDLFQKFLSARWQFFVMHDHGVLGNTILRETEKIGMAFDDVAKVLSNGMRALAFIGVACFLSWRLTALALVLIGVVLIPFLLLGKLTYRIGSVHIHSSNRFQGSMIETLGAAKLILGFGNQHKSFKTLTRDLIPFLKSSVQFVIVRAVTPLAFEPLGFLIALGVFAIGASRFTLELSSLLVILYALRSAADSLHQAVNEQNHLLNVAPAVEQIDRLREEAVRVAQSSGERSFERLERAVEFKNVSFTYANRSEMLKNVDLTLSRGRMTAIVGRSGSGKTTCLDLLMGFYEPSAGSVEIDGKSLGEFDIMSWRRRIGFVPQDPFLFNASLRDNLLWADEKATTEDMRKVCELAYANEFIDELPKGLDTVVGNRGVRLSGGQKQRIALARALLRKPEILILDEATSALDTHSERLIQQSVEQVAREITVVVVAHRLSTIRGAHRIYVLDKGVVAESGSFDELMRKSGGSFLRAAELQGLKTHA